MTRASLDPDTVTRGFYADLDANDPDVFQRWLAPEAEFSFNDLDPVVGVGAIADFVGAWKDNFASVTHDLANLASDLTIHTVGVEIVVRYEFRDGRHVDVKGCSFLDVAGERITGWRVYVDTSRLS
jgi:ketosteroid isomerase-like protein